MQVKQQEAILVLIARSLAGQADSDEEAKLNEWVNSSESNFHYFEDLKNIWNESEKKIDPGSISTQIALERVLDRIEIPSFFNTFWVCWQKFAAIIILPLAFGALFWVYHISHKASPVNGQVYNEIFAAFGTRSVIRLADSTMVWLNSGSSLRYPDKFQNKNREVYLNGEAYFEVKSDASRQFIVNTSAFKVKATGTKFNVLDYGSESVAEVTLVSGKVSVNGATDTDHALISLLNPGQHLDFDRETSAKGITHGDTYKYIAWKDGKLIFRNEPLSRVLERISLIFNVDIELLGSDLQDYRYHATFQDESFEEILKLLKLSSPVDYSEVKRNPLPDGSFPRKKVIIFPKNQSTHN
jgi:transmembrane sensor